MEHVQRMMDIVKSQCGKHSIQSMGETLKFEPKLCENKPIEKKDSKVEITPELFEFLKYDNKENVFQCSICKKTMSAEYNKKLKGNKRRSMLRHIFFVHKKELKELQGVPYYYTFLKMNIH